jgi:transketolase
LQPGTGKCALKGAYTLLDSEKDIPDVILIATGSEVDIALGAKVALKQKGVDARVVSMPSWEVFEEQPDEYKESVLPKAVRKRVAIEAGSTFGWERYTGLDGAVIGMKGYGASAPFAKLFDKYGFTVENVVQVVEGL